MCCRRFDVGGDAPINAIQRIGGSQYRAKPSNAGCVRSLMRYFGDAGRPSVTPLLAEGFATSGRDRVTRARRRDPRRSRPSRSTGPCITATRHFPARPSVPAAFPATLDPRLHSALRGRGIEHLYSHQARCWELVEKGHSLVVVTPTASGKTLCYNLPVLQALLEHADSRVLYLFPTRRWPRINWPSWRSWPRRCPISACSPTTGTRHRTRGARYEPAPTSC